MITDDQITDAIYNTGNSHDPIAAVKALLKQAWDECFDYCSEEIAHGMNPADSNPYDAEEAADDH